jgi:hypothetical protein
MASRRGGGDAAAGPLAGAHIHPWVSAPPSSGSVSVTVALVVRLAHPDLAVRRRAPHGRVVRQRKEELAQLTWAVSRRGELSSSSTARAPRGGTSRIVPTTE